MVKQHQVATYLSLVIVLTGALLDYQYHKYAKHRETEPMSEITAKRLEGMYAEMKQRRREAQENER